MLRKLIFSLLLLIPSIGFGAAPPAPFCAQESGNFIDMPASECGLCHETQFQSWTNTRHNHRGVVCSLCHGTLHSGSLKGCLSCHTGKHKLEYEQWEFVRDYVVDGDESNYYCITCHDPHNPVKEKVLVCSGCHGTSTMKMQPRKTIASSLQSSHDFLAVVAAGMDQETWNRRLKSTGGKILLAGGTLVIGSVLVFPYLYTIRGLLRWLRQRRRR